MGGDSVDGLGSFSSTLYLQTIHLVLRVLLIFNQLTNLILTAFLRPSSSSSDPRSIPSSDSVVLPPNPAAMSAPGPEPSSSTMLKKAFPHVDTDGHDLPPSPAPSSPRAGKRYAIATELVYTESNDQYNASSVPIYQVRAGFLGVAGGGGWFRISVWANCCGRALHLDKRLVVEVESTTTPGPAIPRALISNDTLRR